jgi:HEAT repeat protein
LLYSGDQGIVVLLRNLLTSSRSDDRQLAAIGLGLLHDKPSVPVLVDLLHDLHPGVLRATCLALVSIGGQTGLEALAAAILHGSEQLRSTAAKALAYHPEEGYPILKDGSEMDDLLVRRAVVYGLARVRAPWARQILDKLAVDDNEWIVRTAATHAIEQATLPDFGIPRRPSPLNESNWLITFAGERGIGVAPGRPAQELMLKALEEGNREQKLAAMEHLRYASYPPAGPTLTRIMFEADEELKQAAYDALWYHHARGSPSS